MLDIPGYRDLVPIYEGSNSLVFRALPEQGETPVVLKVLNREFPTPKEISRFQREYEILSALKDATHIIHARALEQHWHTAILVLEDFAGQSLKRWLEQKRVFSLAEGLGLAIQLTDSLAEIHAAHVVHRDLNPANILLAESTGEVKLIDFGISTLLSSETTSLKHPSFLQGTLEYISPEQTGRMNRAVDFRTDFYSLGATLYELFSGRPPFVVEDSMELIHCHMAKKPTPLCGLCPAVPAPVSAIVGKLLAKTPEERYQSTWGLKADLEKCRRQLQEQGCIQPFALGEADFSDRLILPQRLYGREGEIGRILEGFARVSEGQKEVLLISGSSGVGKTALVQEVYRSLTRLSGTFIAGKFEQLQRDTPYTAFVGAFSQLARQLLTEPPESLRQWKERLLGALGNNGKVLLEILPDFGAILGAQPDVVLLPPEEQQHRFNDVFQKFVSVFATMDHPLVIFIDDLQWADSSSLKLLDRMLTSPQVGCLFFIGSLRDSEVGPAHPLVSTLSKIEQSGCRLEHLALKPLGFLHVNELLSETLLRLPEDTDALSRLLLEKTAGNPFFLKEFLGALIEQKLVCADRQLRRWEWDLARIAVQGMTDNVAALMVERIGKERDEVQQILKIAACVGNRFDLETVSTVTQMPPAAIIVALEPAIGSGLILALEDVTDLVSGRSSGETPDLEFKFAHDRIQQAAYSLIPDEEKARFHLRIGRLLLQKVPPEREEARVFDIAYHMNQAIELIESAADREELARLNLLAGQRAKASAAYEPAARYLITALGLLDAEGDWTERYALMRKLREEAAETSYLVGDYERMERWTGEILEHAVGLLDQVRAYDIRIAAYTAQHNNQLAIQTGLAILARLGLRLPDRPRKIHLLLGLLKTRLALRGRPIEALAELPDMSDAHHLSQLRIMRSISASVYFARPLLMPVMLFEQIRLLLRHGHTEHSATVFGSWGIVLCGPLGDIERGYQVGKLIPRLLERAGGHRHRCRAVFLVNSFNRHWKEPLQDVLPALRECSQIGIEAGDVQYAALAAHMYCHYSYFQGTNLMEGFAQVSALTRVIDQLKQESALGFNRIVEQVMLNLLGRASDPLSLVGESLDEVKAVPALRQAQDRTALFGLFSIKLQLSVLFRDYANAIRYSDEAREHLGAVNGFFGVSRHNLFDSLARLAHYPTQSFRGKRQIRRRVASNQRQMKRWAGHCPENHLHCYQLVEAERHRILGRPARAEPHYEQAVELARKHGFNNDEALAADLCAEFHRERGNTLRLNHYVQAAYRAYLRWGAKAKVKDLEVRFGQLLSKTSARPAAQYTLSVTSSVTSSLTFDGGDEPSSSITLPPGVLNRITTAQPSKSGTVGTLEQMFDLGSVIKASQSISGEVELSKLLDKLMKIALENAGADKGFLILAQDERLTIEATAFLEQIDQPRILSLPLAECAELSPAVVNYVARTQSNVLLTDEATRTQFGKDAYLDRSPPRSLLCIPVVRNAKLIGVLYLENNHAGDAFTPERVQVLQLLASQAAISIDNARLVGRLQEAIVRAEQSDRLKSELLDRTSHELRTPLNTIINLPEGILREYVREALRCPGCGGLFERGEKDLSSERTRCPACGSEAPMGGEEIYAFDGKDHKIGGMLRDVVRCGRQLDGIVNELLDMSSLRAGGTKLEIEPVPVSALLLELKEALELREGEGGARIPVQIREIEPGLRVQADRGKLKKILGNLISNAIKFSPPGGRVWVEVSGLGEEITFVIHDEGMGILKEQQERIFDGFYQTDGGATRRFGGLGLGLSIARSLVELHGGQIWLQSAQGEGTSFFVRLPRSGKVLGQEEKPAEMS